VGALFSVASVGVVTGPASPLSGGPWLALPVAVAVLLSVLAVRRRGPRKGPARARPYAVLEDAERDEARRLYARALWLLRRRGNSQRMPHQGMQEYLAQIAGAGSIDGDAFARITASASAASYDPRPFPGQRVQDAKSALKSLEREGG
jgi:hypothetical protein